MAVTNDKPGTSTATRATIGVLVVLALLAAAVGVLA